LREAPGEKGGPLRVHPLGTLAVHQTVAPLNVTLQKAGEADIAGPQKLVLTALTIGGVTTDATTLPVIKEHFAASQFFSMDEQRRLTQPGFERMQVGG